MVETFTDIDTREPAIQIAGRFLGIVVFLVGIAMLGLSFSLAYRAFNEPDLLIPIQDLTRNTATMPSLVYLRIVLKLVLLFAMGYIGSLVAATGIMIAYRFYVAHPEAPQKLAVRLKSIYGLLLNKYYVDETYDAAIVNPVALGSREILWRGIDVGIIDGAVNGMARMVQGAGSVLKNVQNGLARSYAAWILVGVVAILIYITAHPWFTLWLSRP
jgi:NADH:ubiquinone oxidoreductase subunit 5 (subunit L)/multisubunit Na+/H+ antiporter MnhA subunit